MAARVRASCESWTTERTHLLLQLGGMLHTAPGLVPGVDELPRSLTGVRLPLALWLATATPRCEPLMSARRRHPATRGGRTDLPIGTNRRAEPRKRNHYLLPCCTTIHATVSLANTGCLTTS